MYQHYFLGAKKEKLFQKVFSKTSKINLREKLLITLYIQTTCFVDAKMTENKIKTI